ncbi:hypothetical protein GURKE_00430 [Brevundimonas phage vB_BpoS-Gurke]|uniref:Uncharacterized protein n=1 Tax=Brevundimonas phage vB_BpoS-Gurke TaxID=2948599 RepID=A0A9E7N3A6_9CAUD|nr:hypothetical protein GURKE_00430 [Brevundimonas phage vB_BpoS-Gurke]
MKLYLFLAVLVSLFGAAKARWTFRQLRNDGPYQVEAAILIGIYAIVSIALCLAVLFEWSASAA